MFRLLKQLFSTDEDKRTVVILEEHGLKPSSKYSYRPVNLWALSLGFLSVIVGFVLILFIFTPLGGFAYNQKEMRQSVIAIQQRVAALQDTLAARNKQLTQMRHVMAIGKDTVFTSAPVEKNNAPSQSATASDEKSDEKSTAKRIPKSTVERIPNNALLISNLLQKAPSFPTTYPTDGILTRTFNSKNGHFGIDIATEKGSTFTAIADGVIISQEWTINYGYVIVIQHSDNLVTIYKHAKSAKNRVGDMVLKGDILGTIGDVGIISSGPHLHVEIWDEGIARNPKNYFINT